jgi:hypothetical protein
VHDHFIDAGAHGYGFRDRDANPAGDRQRHAGEQCMLNVDNERHAHAVRHADAISFAHGKRDRESDGRDLRPGR